MTAYVVRDAISNEIAMACEECGTTGEWMENRPGNRVVVNNMVTTHNSAQHWTNPLKDFNGHTPHMVTGQDFTESPKEEGEDKAMKVLSDALRVKNMRIRQLEETVRCLTIDVKSANNRVWEAVETIEELMKTPDPMPLCKNLEGHNYVPLDQMFVFCTRCGHSIHYKTK